jgi:hypothetical protein
VFHRCGRAIRRNIGTLTKLIVGHCLQMVRLRQEPPHVRVNARLKSGQLRELAPHAAMSLGDFAGVIEDVGLRGMEGDQIGVSPGLIEIAIFHEAPRGGQKFARLVEIEGPRARHSSTPSRRISPMSGVAS